MFLSLFIFRKQNLPGSAHRLRSQFYGPRTKLPGSIDRLSSKCTDSTETPWVYTQTTQQAYRLSTETPWVCPQTTQRAYRAQKLPGQFKDSAAHTKQQMFRQSSETSPVNPKTEQKVYRLSTETPWAYPQTTQ